MRIPIVNKQDEILGYKDRNDTNLNDIIRVSGVWVYNSQKKVLIAQRSPNKKHEAGKWAPSVGGTVEEGETYLTNAIKEIEEEIGIIAKEKDLTVGVHRLSANDTFFGQVYFYKTDISTSDFILQEDEVAQVKWISIDELKQWYTKNPQDFIETFKGALQDIEGFLS